MGEGHELTRTAPGAFDVAPIADAVTPPAFHTVLKMCDTLMEEKHWAALTRSAGALHQMMAGVQRLCSDTSYEKNRNIGKQIYLHIFSEMTYLKIFPALVKVYDGKKHFRELLISAVSTADIVLNLLEEVATEGFVTTRKMKVTRKVARPDQPDGTLAAQMEPERIVERREKVVELDFVDHVTVMMILDLLNFTLADIKPTPFGVNDDTICLHSSEVKIQNLKLEIKN